MISKLKAEYVGEKQIFFENPGSEAASRELNLKFSFKEISFTLIMSCITQMNYRLVNNQNIREIGFKITGIHGGKDNKFDVIPIEFPTNLPFSPKELEDSESHSEDRFLEYERKVERLGKGFIVNVKNLN